MGFNIFMCCQCPLEHIEVFQKYKTYIIDSYICYSVLLLIDLNCQQNICSPFESKNSSNIQYLFLKFQADQTFNQSLFQTFFVHFQYCYQVHYVKIVAKLVSFQRMHQRNTRKEVETIIALHYFIPNNNGIELFSFRKPLKQVYY